MTNVTEEHLRLLEQRFTDDPVDFVIPLGDNWLSTWEWAKMLEREYGVDHQEAIRAAHDRFFVSRHE
jgi:hypothetical protein